MRRKLTASCLVGTAILLAGCSGDSEDGGASDAPAKKAKDSAMVTVEYRVTGDSPASASSPGVKGEAYTGTKSADGESDLDVEGIETPWSKQMKIKPHRSLTLQVASEDPKKEIGCKILVDGKVVDEETKKNKPGYTLNTVCSGRTTP